MDTLRDFSSPSARFSVTPSCRSALGWSEIQVQMNAHVENPQVPKAEYGPVNNNWTTGAYHTVGMLHTDSTVAFFIDNKMVGSTSMNLPDTMYILMGLQLGSVNFKDGFSTDPVPSTWPGGINGPMTADLRIDWVHLWKP
jgi:hypothetical protein